MSATTPEERLRVALDMSGVGEQLMRSRLRRENPDASEEWLQAALERWLHDRPGAPFGDYPGPRSSRILGERSR